MAAMMDPSSPTAMAGAALPASLAGRSWAGTALLVIATAIAAAASAWLGYQSHLEPSASQQQGSASTSALQDPPPDTLQDLAIVAKPALPRAALRDDRKSSGLSWPLWEFRLRQPIPPRDPSLTPPTWRLIGSALSGGKWSVIVLQQGGTVPEYFSVGQELPGGYRIESISDEDVTLAKGKRLMVLSYIGSR